LPYGNKFLMQLLPHAVVSIMGRRNGYKAFVPTSPPAGFVKPANGMFEWAKPPVVDPATAADVDKAKKRLSITANYSIGTDDHFVGVDTTGGSVTLTLPTRAATSEGKIYIIKDEGGWAATNSIVIQTADSAKIDNLNSVALVSNYGAISIYFNATDWHIY
jgi:hypothetical protein